MYQVHQSKNRIALSLATLHAAASVLSYTGIFWTLNRVKASLAWSGSVRNAEEIIPDDRLAIQTQELFPENLTPETQAEVDEFDFYRLGSGDAINVIVPRFQDLSFQAQIDLQGNITFPLLGKVSLEGLTLEEAQERIRFGLNRFIIDPTVILTLVNRRPVQVTITGEVVRQGFYPLGQPSLSTALLISGGTTQQADLRRVLVRRTLIDGSVIEKEIDLFSPLKNFDPIPDLRLENGDVVIVPQLSPDDRDYDRALIATTNLAEPQITLKLLRYPGGIGNLALPNGSTFVDALAAIGANPDISDIRNIALIRFDPEEGRTVTYILDGKSALLGDTDQDLLLRNNDVIAVGRTLISRISFALTTITQPFRDILGFLLFFNQFDNVFNDDRRRRN
ncbi:MAG: polysaccharide biosynthesis/export family protein [Hormoscilla sp.]